MTAIQHYFLLYKLQNVHKKYQYSDDLAKLLGYETNKLNMLRCQNDLKYHYPYDYVVDYCGKL